VVPGVEAGFLHSIISCGHLAGGLIQQPFAFSEWRVGHGWASRDGPPACGFSALVAFGAGHIFQAGRTNESCRKAGQASVTLPGALLLAFLADGGDSRFAQNLPARRAGPGMADGDSHRAGTSFRVGRHGSGCPGSGSSAAFFGHTRDGWGGFIAGEGETAARARGRWSADRSLSGQSGQYVTSLPYDHEPEATLSASRAGASSAQQASTFPNSSCQFSQEPEDGVPFVAEMNDASIYEPGTFGYPWLS